MRSIIYIFSAFLFITSCRSVTGSGNIISQNRSTGNFSGVSAHASIEVEISTGPEYKVRVEADDNVINDVATSVSDGMLKIDYKHSINLNDAHVKVYVTAPTLSRINASSSSEVEVVGELKNDGKVQFSCSSSGSIKAKVNAPEVSAEVSSSGNIDLTGHTRTYTAEANSSGDLNSFGLLSEVTNASASSSGTVEVHASISLDAKASSSGEVKYKGGAKVNETISSSGSIQKTE